MRSRIAATYQLLAAAAGVGWGERGVAGRERLTTHINWLTLLGAILLLWITPTEQIV